MNRIEFEMRATKSDLMRLAIARLLMSRFFLGYLVFTAIAVCVLGVLAQINEERAEFYSMLLFFLLLGGACPVAYVLGKANQSYKSFWKGRERIFFVEPQGCGSRSETMQVRMKWQSFDAIRETASYIFIKSYKNARARFVIYKYLLPREVVLAIKKVLGQVPVANKKLLPETETSVPETSLRQDGEHTNFWCAEPGKERIEFEMKPHKNDLYTLSISVLLGWRFFRIYLFLAISALLAIGILALVRKDSAGSYLTAGSIVLLALVFPFAFMLGMADFHFRRSWKSEGAVFALDKTGWGCRTDTRDVFVKWTAADKISETRNYIFIKPPANPRTAMVIHKGLLPSETLRAIKRILLEVPAVNKRLVAETGRPVPSDC